MSPLWTLRIESCGKCQADAIKHVERLLTLLREANGFSVSSEKGSAGATWEETQDPGGDDE